MLIGMTNTQYTNSSLNDVPPGVLVYLTNTHKSNVVYLWCLCPNPKILSFCIISHMYHYSKKIGVNMKVTLNDINHLNKNLNTDKCKHT